MARRKAKKRDRSKIKDRRARGVCITCEGALAQTSGRFCEHHKDLTNAAANARQKRLAAAGICVKCLKDRRRIDGHEPTKDMCGTCAHTVNRKRAANSHRARHVLGKCFRCHKGNPVGDKLLCVGCAKAENRTFKTIYWTRADAGLCIRCKVPVTRFRTCVTCRRWGRIRRNDRLDFKEEKVFANVA